MNYLNNSIKTFFRYLKGKSPQDVSFTHTKPMFDREKLIIIIFGGYIFSCPTPYNLKFRYFETKSLVPRTLN